MKEMSLNKNSLVNYFVCKNFLKVKNLQNSEDKLKMKYKIQKDLVKVLAIMNQKVFKLNWYNIYINKIGHLKEFSPEIQKLNAIIHELKL